MADADSQFKFISLPLRQLQDGERTIPAPTYQSFISHFGDAFLRPTFLESDLGSTAVYDIPVADSGNSTANTRHVLIVHGLNTPALGMWQLAKDIQSIEPNTHIVLFDLWGHGLSSTPLVAHAAHIFHQQIMQVLLFKGWTTAHLLGFSFGGATSVSFALQNPWVVESVILLAPAGLIDSDQFSVEMKSLLSRPEGSGQAAQECVLEWLEGGPLVVPKDWKEKSQNGQFVAEAFRKWELDQHSGYRASVFSIFRDGGVTGQEESFRRFVEQRFKKAAVVGGNDPVCSKQQLVDLGFDQNEVAAIPNAGHSLVRDRTIEVAEAVVRVWNR